MTLDDFYSWYALHYDSIPYSVQYHLNLAWGRQVAGRVSDYIEAHEYVDYAYWIQEHRNALCEPQLNVEIGDRAFGFLDDYMTDKYLYGPLYLPGYWGNTEDYYLEYLQSCRSYHTFVYGRQLDIVENLLNQGIIDPNYRFTPSSQHGHIAWLRYNDSAERVLRTPFTIDNIEMLWSRIDQYMVNNMLYWTNDKTGLDEALLEQLHSGWDHTEFIAAATWYGVIEDYQNNYPQHSFLSGEMFLDSIDAALIDRPV